MKGKKKSSLHRKAVKPEQKKQVHAKQKAVLSLPQVSFEPESKGRSPKMAIFAAFVFVILIASLNYATGALTFTAKLPFFFDTWATSAAAMVGGLWAGVVGGLIYNLFMAYTTWGSPQWVWAFSSMWVAFATWMLYKDKWISIHNPRKLLAAGAVIGITNTFIVFSISLLAFGRVPDYSSTMFIQDAFRSWFGNTAIASFVETLIVNLADKIISITVAAAVVAYVPANYKAYFHRV